MGTINDVVSPWGEIGSSLDVLYPNDYFFKNKYRAQNPFTLLFPPLTVPGAGGGSVDIRNSFFGTKMLNIFIIQKPYGYDGDEDDGIDWDDPDSTWSRAVDGAIQTWNTVQARRFPYYKTLVFADWWSLERVPDPDPFLIDYIAKFGKSVAKFKSVIPSITGFEYAADLHEAVGEGYFQEYITSHFGSPKYKL